MRRIFVSLSAVLSARGWVMPAVAVGNVARGPGGAAYDVKLISDAGEAFATYATDLPTGATAEGCRPGQVAARMLHDLQRFIGTPAMEKLMKSYAKSHWYGVSTPADLKSAAGAAPQTDLAPFWSSHTMY